MTLRSAAVLFSLLIAVAAGESLAEATPGLRASAVLGAPVGSGDGTSWRVAVEPAIRAGGKDLEARAAFRARKMRIGGEESEDVSIRDLFLVYRQAGFTGSIGAQQVNWGRMDIVRITDNVNPVDEKDLYLEDLPDAKKPLWMANLEWDTGDSVFQLLLSPEIPVDTLPHRRHGLPIAMKTQKDRLRNGTIAARYGFEAASWNIDLVAYRGWDPSPSLRLQPDGELSGEVHRVTRLGFSADRPVGKLVVRTEGAFSPSQAYPGNWMTEVQKSSRFSLGTGVDVQAGQWFLTGQVIVDRFSDTDVRAVFPRQNVYASLTAQRKWFQDRLQFRLAGITESHRHSYWISAQTNVELDSHQEVRIQLDRFGGPQDSHFGQLTSRSRIAFVYRITY